MDVCDETYVIMNASVGLLVRFATASELMRHTVSMTRSFQALAGRTELPLLLL